MWTTNKDHTIREVGARYSRDHRSSSILCYTFNGCITTMRKAIRIQFWFIYSLFSRFTRRNFQPSLWDSFDALFLCVIIYYWTVNFISLCVCLINIQADDHFRFIKPIAVIFFIVALIRMSIATITKENLKKTIHK